VTELDRTPEIEADIAKTVARFGWDYDRVDDGLFRTGIQGENGEHDVFIRVTEHWVTVTIPLFVDRPDDGWGACALKILATANHTMNMAKMGLDDVDDVFLTVELPSEGFGESHLYDALGALSHYAEKLVMAVIQATRIDALNASANP
jgi:hypothetical protein